PDIRKKYREFPVLWRKRHKPIRSTSLTSCRGFFGMKPTLHQRIKLRRMPSQKTHLVGAIGMHAIERLLESPYTALVVAVIVGALALSGKFNVTVTHLLL